MFGDEARKQSSIIAFVSKRSYRYSYLAAAKYVFVKYYVIVFVNY